MADEYPHSFGSCVFWASIDRSLSFKQQLTKTKIPGGDTTYLDDGGRESPTWAGTVLLPDIGWFRVLQETRGEQTLVTNEGTYRGVLAELESTEYWRDGEPRKARVVFELTQWP